MLKEVVKAAEKSRKVLVEIKKVVPLHSQRKNGVSQ
jgi:hypothetical protein